MTLRKPSFLLAAAISGFALASTANAQFTQVWQLGIDNGNQTEFSQENAATNPAPGSATIMDDDWYFAGIYPAPIGPLVSNEPNLNFERALVIADPINRVHFNLSAPLTLEGTEFRLLIDTVSNNTAVTTDPIAFSVLFNDVPVFSGTVNQVNQFFMSPSFFVGTDPGEVPATTGDNVVTLLRETTGAGWMQFDYVRLEAVPEPTAALSLAAGALVLGSVRRRRK